MSYVATATDTLDEEEPRARICLDKSRAESPWQGIGMLVALLVVSLVALAVLASTVVRLDGNTTVWDSLMGFIEREEPAGYGGIKFGMTPTGALKARPDLLLADLPGGESAGSFEWQGVPHSVAFLPTSRGNKAYRIRNVRNVAPESADAILGSLTRALGPPLESDCGKRIFDATRTCHYRWMAPKGVSLALTTRPVTAAGAPRTEVTLNAVDTYLQSKRRHGAVRR